MKYDAIRRWLITYHTVPGTSYSVSRLFLLLLPIIGVMALFDPLVLLWFAGGITTRIFIDWLRD